MPILVRLDKVLAARGVLAKDMARELGMTEANVSLLRTGKARAIRFSTLASICEYLSCQPGDVLLYSSGEPEADDIRSVLETADDINFIPDT